MAPKKDIEDILDNEREWRRIIFTKVDKIENEVRGLIIWGYIFRAGGALLVGLLYAYIEKKIGG